MKVTTIFKPLNNLFTYLDYYLKIRRIRADWAKVKEAWIRMGGFSASTEQLLKFLRDYSVHIVEYATWTTTTIDDQFAAIIASVLNNHQAILEVIINRIRAGRELSATQMSSMLETIGVSSDEQSTPMMTLYIISVIYYALISGATNCRKRTKTPIASRN